MRRGFFAPIQMVGFKVLELSSRKKTARIKISYVAGMIIERRLEGGGWRAWGTGHRAQGTDNERL